MQDCYEKLTKRLARDVNGEAEINGRNGKQKKTKHSDQNCLKTNCTFIGIGVEEKQKYHEIVGARGNSLYSQTGKACLISKQCQEY